MFNNNDDKDDDSCFRYSPIIYNDSSVGRADSWFESHCYSVSFGQQRSADILIHKTDP